MSPWRPPRIPLLGSEADRICRINHRASRIAVDRAFDVPPDEPVDLTHEIGGRRGVETFGPVDQYRRQIEYFADCVTGDRTPVTDGPSAVKNMRVVDASSESAAGGSVVNV